MNSQALYAEWLKAKDEEKAAIERRRTIEDMITTALGISESDDGQKTITEGQYKVRVTHRMTRSVSSASLQTLARENGISNEQLGKWFRWSADINAKEFKAAGDAVNPLLPAITTKPSRPSYSIEIIEQEQN